MTLQKDFKEFIELLIENKVRFLIVGAHAVAFHGFPRFTGDIDFFFDSEPDNVLRLTSTLNDFGFSISQEQLSLPEKVFQLGVPPNRIDLLNWLSGINFIEAWKNKVSGQIDELNVFFIGKDDLIKNKKASGRKKDLIDLDALLE